ncbi:hypothetical protein LOC68_15150 [Blastopirellula sp. JC732]|uniref:Uncharacterized protein n=1 Tax=Blastopirellula sediminis TaxID=2894196 RepID=A0A9X1SH56_9BACT|nr:hypothetical protein [Blastopirellula sediminis]MCC9606978.1 hypothetical protein [Blastopirellula sediminis]MCC9629727.1 hypothetical protein [Blastopirellula sediminis]
MFPPVYRLSIVALLATCVCGCALWQNDKTTEPSTLPSGNLSDDTVILETTKVRIPTVQEDAVAQMWLEVDEQFMPATMRSRLYENGIRVGLINYHLPQQIRDLLAASSGKEGLNGQSSVLIKDGEVPIAEQRRFRKGKRGELVASDVMPELTCFVKEGDAVTGETYYQAQCRFAILTYPQGDGRVLIELIPEIQHGQPQREFSSSGDGVFQLAAKPRSEPLTDLTMKAIMSPGETLILGATDELRGVGKSFFTRSDGRRQVLLIRLAASQTDGLFAGEVEKTPEPGEISPVKAESTESYSSVRFD